MKSEAFWASVLRFWATIAQHVACGKAIKRTKLLLKDNPVGDKAPV